MAKINNKPAAAYAKPHTMSGKAVSIKDVGIVPKMRPSEQEWTPMQGVSVKNEQLTGPLGTKTDGIKIRGTGAATKGLMARGPMA